MTATRWDRERLLRAVTATGWDVTAAARAAGINVSTFVYWLKSAGIERPKVAAPIECHPPTAALMGELARLRRHAAQLRANYQATPERAALLRENELAQRAILARVRSLLGDQPVFGGVRGGPASGAMRPGWGLRF